MKPDQKYGLVSILLPWLFYFICPIVILSFYITLTYIGILSSIAEVSHYLCHNSNSAVVIFLMRIKVLLPKREHARHHLEDNVSYTFLNSVTNPLVDLSPRCFLPDIKTKQICIMPSILGQTCRDAKQQARQTGCVFASFSKW